MPRPACTWRMPNQNGFFREQEKASASVVLTLHPGRTLDRAQIAGIVHLVSRSVPELKASDVSVIDSSGALLNPQDRRQRPGLAAAASTVASIETAARAARARTARAGGRPRQPARHASRADDRLLAGRIHRRGIPAEPGRRAGHRARACAPKNRPSPGSDAPAGVPGAHEQPAAGAGDGADHRRRRAAAGRAGRPAPAATRAARPRPATRSTRPCA